MDYIYIISRLQSQIGDYDLTKLQLMSTWRGAIGSRSIRSSRFGWPCCTDMCKIKCRNILQYFVFQKMRNSIWIFVISEILYLWTLYSLHCHHNRYTNLPAGKAKLCAAEINLKGCAISSAIFRASLSQGVKKCLHQTKYERRETSIQSAPLQRSLHLWSSTQDRCHRCPSSFRPRESWPWCSNLY